MYYKFIEEQKCKKIIMTMINILFKKRQKIIDKHKDFNNKDKHIKLCKHKAFKKETLLFNKTL